MSDLKGKYKIRIGNNAFQDIETMFGGASILKIDSLNKRGKPKNIFRQEWIDSDSDDVHIPNNVYFSTPKINLTFIVRDRELEEPYTSMQILHSHDNLVNTFMRNKVTIRSEYEESQCDVICVEEYAPTTVRLHRETGTNYIMGTLKLQVVSPITN